MENNRNLEMKRKEALALIEEWERLETKDIRSVTEITSKEKEVKYETV